MLTKNVAVKVKATAADDSTLAEGQFVALASVFNNVDAVGDVVLPGAFTEDLKAWSDSGDVIPVYWGHRMDDPSMNIGSVIDATETDDGLLVTAQLDLESTQGAQVYRLLKGRRVNRMSFAYDILDAAPAERDGGQVYELRKLKLHEVSVVQVPANPAAVVQSVKAGTAATVDAGSLGPWLTFTSGGNIVTATTTTDIVSGLKAGRTLSAKNEKALRSALDQINAGVTEVKSVLDSLESKDGKANPAAPAAPEESDGTKGDAPARPGPASLRLRTDLDALAFEVFTLTD